MKSAAMMAGTAIILGLFGVTLLLASAQAMECAGLMLTEPN